jgi:branched-chain amino acid transport system substrate-binding protein
MKRLSRRGMLRVGMAGIGALAAPAIIVRPGWTQSGPIKIGMLEARSGPNKYVSDARIAATEFAADRVNTTGGLFGRKVEIAVADSEFKPDVAARRANELLLGDKVDVIIAFGGGVAKVAAQAASKAEKLFVSTSTLPAELTGAEFMPTTFSLAFNSEMISQGVAAYIAGSGLKKVFILCQDYASGRSAGETFKKRFNASKKPDQAIVGEEYHPTFKLTDFAPYITKVMASGADALMTANFGPDLRLLIQQGAQLGWNIKVVGFYLNDPTLAIAIGDALVGHITVGINQITLDTPAQRKLLEEWKPRFKDAPHFYRVPDLATGQAVNGAMWLLEVMRKTGTVDTAALIRTWEGDKYEAPWGQAELRSCDHQIISPCGVAEFLPPTKIPEQLRFYGMEFPYIGPASVIPANAVAVPLNETGNKRCIA